MNKYLAQSMNKKEGYHSKEEEEGSTLKLQFKNLHLGLIYMWYKVWI